MAGFLQCGFFYTNKVVGLPRLGKRLTSSTSVPRLLVLGQLSTPCNTYIGGRSSFGGGERSLRASECTKFMELGNSRTSMWPHKMPGFRWTLPIIVDCQFRTNTCKGMPGQPPPLSKIVTLFQALCKVIQRGAWWFPAYKRTGSVQHMWGIKQGHYKIFNSAGSWNRRTVSTGDQELMEGE